MEKIKKPQFLTIKETAKTGILPEAALRTLVKRGKIPGFYSGKKFLINTDLLIEMLNDPEWLSSLNTGNDYTKDSSTR